MEDKMGKKKRKIKLGSIFFVIIIILLFVCFCIIKNLGSKKPVAAQVEVIDSIDNFEYQLNDNETKYYTDLFNELKELLHNEVYDEEEYAVLIGKLFLCDFYDLNSKVMKSDVGGTQFVYSEYRSDFELGAIDSVYKFIESNVYGDRNQVLPIVKSVDNVDIEQKSFEYGDDIDFDSYYLTMNINYEKNLDYPNRVLLVLIHNNDKLEIAKMETLN